MSNFVIRHIVSELVTRGPSNYAVSWDRAENSVTVKDPDGAIVYRIDVATFSSYRAVTDGDEILTQAIEAMTHNEMGRDAAKRVSAEMGLQVSYSQGFYVVKFLTKCDYHQSVDSVRQAYKDRRGGNVIRLPAPSAKPDDRGREMRD